MSSDCTYVHNTFPAIPLACCSDASAISCDSTGTRVTSLVLSATQLTGSIPADINTLINLQTLRLDTNLLSGSIPSTIGTFQQLSVLHLESNSLTGPLPDSIGNLTALRFIDVHNNMLSGTIPDSISNLMNLQQLTLDGNAFTGLFPSSVGRMTQLTKINVNRNQLAGIVDLDFRNLTLLNYVDFSSNPALSGTIRLASCAMPSGSQGWDFGNLKCSTDPPPLFSASSGANTPLNPVPTSSLSPTPGSPSSSSSSSLPMAAIIGSVAGVVVLLGVIAALFFARRKKATTQARAYESDHQRTSFGGGSHVGLTDPTLPTEATPPLPNLYDAGHPLRVNTAHSVAVSSAPSADTQPSFDVRRTVTSMDALSFPALPSPLTARTATHQSDSAVSPHASYRMDYSPADTISMAVSGSGKHVWPFYTGGDSKYRYRESSGPRNSGSDTMEMTSVSSGQSSANYEVVEFHDANGIEIELNVGDRIQLFQAFDRDRAEGKNESTGAVGMIPIHKIRPIFQGALRLPAYSSIDRPH
ncbi:uncharacterized protein BJ171DRAFT_489584 [Polychytrium aggregatum]|uniref:uncharacterized protein n=1 Tax=Polychytrium aggregatum TaxID=110093 RepID=UPI0022FE3D6D|nr:uncharacterized protein BJ171DRAFT_489584 [Polychytrium aggregatum]KAI9208651.1 hypothetical protein BJ171DRAFT_489584 [Polychytrium aggregatum]